MAERLTDKNTISVYNNSNSEIYLGKGEEATKYIYKLAQLEDIMEKYDIKSVENLDSILEKYFSDTWITVTPKIVENWALISDIMASDELNRNFELGITKDRDTWKRACELAVRYICLPQFRDINLGDEFETVKSVENYFYQQAKKESESK